MARNSGDADGASPLAGGGEIDLDALLSGVSTAVGFQASVAE